MRALNMLIGLMRIGVIVYLLTNRNLLSIIVIDVLECGENKTSDVTQV